MKFCIFLFSFIMATSSFSVMAASISTSWEQTKNKLYKKIYPNKGVTFYTGCKWAKRKVDLESCGLQDSFGKSKRRLRTEIEHVFPSSYFYRVNGEYRQCFYQAKSVKESARKYCFKNDSGFNKAHNDLVNLRVSVGSVNLKRSNKPFSNRARGKKPQTFNGLGRSVYIDSRIIVPDASLRGDIARIAFYMSETYGLTISKRQWELMKAWHISDPVSEDEIWLNKAIHKAQGRSNYFVSVEH